MDKLNRVLYPASTATQGDGCVYGARVRVFSLRRREPDAHLTRFQAGRYKAWLRLRATLRGSGARKEDRWNAFRGSLPAIQDLIRQEPVGPPKGIIKNGVLGGRPGPWAVWETTFKLRDGSPEAKYLEEVESTDTPEKAYDYWTKTILRQTMLVEFKREPAILCLNGKLLSSLEVAHYVWAIVGGMQTVCINCGKTFLCNRKDNQYCSERCKWAKRKANQRAKKSRTL